MWGTRITKVIVPKEVIAVILSLDLVLGTILGVVGFLTLLLLFVLWCTDGPVWRVDSSLVRKRDE